MVSLFGVNLFGRRSGASTETQEDEAAARAALSYAAFDGKTGQALRREQLTPGAFSITTADVSVIDPNSERGTNQDGKSWQAISEDITTSSNLEREDLRALLLLAVKDEEIYKIHLGNLKRAEVVTARLLDKTVKGFVSQYGALNLNSDCLESVMGNPDNFQRYVELLRQEAKSGSAISYTSELTSNRTKSETLLKEYICTYRGNHLSEEETRGIFRSFSPQELEASGLSAKGLQNLAFHAKYSADFAMRTQPELCVGETLETRTERYATNMIRNRIRMKSERDALL